MAPDDGGGPAPLPDAHLPAAETCALALAALAPGGVALERNCLLLLAYQWAAAPQQSRLVELLLDAVAAALVGRLAAAAGTGCVQAALMC
jgi:hypothetical protein